MSDSKNVLTLDSLRQVLNEALGDNRFINIPADQSLLWNGSISSIEFVMVIASLEKRFGISLRNMDTSPANFTLSHILNQMQGNETLEITPVPPAVSRSGLTAAIRYPSHVFAVAVIIFIFLNIVVAASMQSFLARAYSAFLEEGQRLYPYAGNFSQDDFAFAVKHHRISDDSLEKRPTALLMGDSGTMGFFLPASQSIAACIENNLAGTRIQNLAWCGNLIPKDLMLLEAAWDHQFDLVIFTVGRNYFSRLRVAKSTAALRHCSVSWPLFEQFSKRIPQNQRGPFDRYLRSLKSADLWHFGPLRRLSFALFPIMHYQPYFRYLFTMKWLPDYFISDMRWSAQYELQERALEKSPSGIQDSGVLTQDLDQDQLQILEQTILLLAQRNVKTLLYIEPFAPASWPHIVSGSALSMASIMDGVAQRTGAKVVDLSWSLEAADFTDSAQHYTASACLRLGAMLASSIQPLLMPQ
ncbi:MAG: hypothetical protein HQM09_20590 [Candidatus Riflebacteria bacterium]|nr:hypothetical protein [Candidatus Riflebacteria bacterium]